jgi:hypothetical protein
MKRLAAVLIVVTVISVATLAEFHVKRAFGKAENTVESLQRRISVLGLYRSSVTMLMARRMSLPTICQSP